MQRIEMPYEINMPKHMKNLILKNENLNPYKKFKFIKDK